MSAHSSASRSVLHRGFLFLAIISAVLLAFVYSRHPDRAQNERSASGSVELIREAIARFRTQYRPAAMDGWEGDVAGLYDFVPPGADRPIEFIPAELAAADPTRPNARPHRGYWFVLLEAEDVGQAGKPASLPLLKTTFCAYPADYGHSGHSTFLRADGYGHLKADTKGVPSRRTPSEEELRAGWSKYH